MSEQVKSQEEFLANFNWHNLKKVLMLLMRKLKRIEELVSKTFIATDQEEVVDGTVVRITDRDVIVDINAKSEVLFH
jgi:small subunit ribosomal protein S1